MEAKDGRAGNLGRATTFFDVDEDAQHAGFYVQVLEDANHEVPKFLQEILDSQKLADEEVLQRNHMRKLLTGDGPKEISEALPDVQLRPTLEKLLCLLGKIQYFAKASFLQLGEISEFGNLVDEYVACLKEKLPAVTITLKCHLLFVHVRNFMYQHLFWGLISEQSIEALHAMVNKDERRLAGLRNRSEILEKIMQYSFLRNVLFDMEIACEDEEELFQ
uniref:Uncharacterized protein n=1 Tax=Ditylenchus dipsaci TaxID=166011 RepID=A0A915CR17_9BILA